MPQSRQLQVLIAEAIMRFTVALFGLAVLVGVAPSTAAENYPSRAVTLIVTGTPGSPPDIVARWLADVLAPSLKQPVTVVNRPGAGGNIAMQAGARSEPDGYTLVIAGQGPFALNPHMYARPGYDPFADFAPITQIDRGPLVLAVHTDVPARSVEDLVGLARRQPGKLNYGSPGTGTPPHMASEMFRRMAKIDVVPIPYPGPPAAMADLLAGRLTFTFGAIAVQMAQVRAGKIRALAVSSGKRMPVTGDIPTFVESGLPEFEYYGWIGIAAPARTPPAIVSRLQAAIAAILDMPETRAHFGKQGREPVGSTPEAFRQYIRQEFDRWGPIIRDAGIKAE
jgi:tripartite-type tricarboxylate transporter receptor subunit TctC